jgi:hypothetical protein
MRGYSAIGSNASGSATKTALTVIAAATVRPALFDLVLGNSTTPADQAANLAIKRFTAAGTAGSSPTPQSNDPGDVAALATAGAAHSVEPTYTAGATLLQISMNQRATFRWVASPGYELKAPATAANGLGVQLVAATAATVYDATAYWYE